MNTSSDYLQRFLINRTHIRGEIVKLHHSYQQATSQQAYPTAIAELLGQILASSVLLTATIKFQGMLIIQVQNQGPLELLVAHCNEQFHIRGVAKWQEGYLDYTNALSDGTLAITISPGHGTRYQGIVPLENSNLAAAAAGYFNQSEQLATAIVLAANQEYAAGLLLQRLPSYTTTDADEVYWQELQSAVAQLSSSDLLALENELIISQLFQHEDVIVYDPEPVEFRCTCSEQRSANAIRALSQEDIDDLLTTYKQITVTCEFCHQNYNYDAAAVQAILTSDKQ